MDQGAPETEQPMTQVLADHGRPVDPQGLNRARAVLAQADGRRDLSARAALLERLRAA
jgi:hypothetical protein